MSTRTWCPFEPGGVTTVAHGDTVPPSADIATAETKAAGTAVPSVLSSGWTTSFGSGRSHPIATAMLRNIHFRDTHADKQLAYQTGPARLYGHFGVSSDTGRRRRCDICVKDRCFKPQLQTYRQEAP